jgi:hypothetical protein
MASYIVLWPGGVGSKFVGIVQISRALSIQISSVKYACT